MLGAAETVVVGVVPPVATTTTGLHLVAAADVIQPISHIDRNENPAVANFRVNSHFGVSNINT